MIKPDQLTKYVIKPALEAVKLYSLSAGEQILGTACAESRLGTYLHQVGGPALGILQMEPATHADIWSNYLVYRPELMDTVYKMVPSDMWDTTQKRPHHEILITDLRYAVVMARLKYRRSKTPLAQPGDWCGHARVWKEVYNSVRGAGTEQHFMDSLTTCGVL